MQRAVVLAGAGERCDNRRLGGKLVRRNQRINPGNVHLDHPARADVQVADLAVTHLPVGQADKVLRSADAGVRKVAQQLVVSRLARLRDSVAFNLRAEPPAVKDGENKRTFMSRS
jgi:hypothetical protein